MDFIILNIKYGDSAKDSKDMHGATSLTLAGASLSAPKDHATFESGLSLALAAESNVFKAPLKIVPRMVPSASIYPGPHTK